MTDATEGLRIALESAESDIARLREENAALRAQNAYLAPRQRSGQLVANALHTLDPAFYEAHRCTAIDPFNHDDRVVDYLRAWRESERVIAKTELSAVKERVEQRMDQVIALESVIEGPPFPPDAAVVAKHIANGGVWVVLWQDAHGIDGSLCRNPEDVQKLLRTQGRAPRVISLDACGRLCARPEVKR